MGSNHGGGMELRLISSRAALQPTEGPLNLSTVAMATAYFLPPQYEIIWGTPAMDSTFSKMEFWKFPKGASSCSKGRDPGSLHGLSLGQCPIHPSFPTPAMFHHVPRPLSTLLVHRVDSLLDPKTNFKGYSFNKSWLDYPIPRHTAVQQSF